MAAQLFLDQVDYIFKRVYPKDIAVAMFKDPMNSAMALMPKNTKGTGLIWELRNETSQGGGRSAQFSYAQTNAKGTAGVTFSVPGDRTDYATYQIPGPKLIAAQSDEGSMVRLVGKGFQVCEANIKTSMAHTFWSVGTGVIAKIVADTVPQVGGVGTFEYDDKRGSRFFRIGMVLETYDAPTGGVLDVGTATITKIDRKARLVTYQASGGWNVVLNHYIVQQGDYDQKPVGIPSWVPYDDPQAGDNYFGVNRSKDRIILAGVAIDSSAATSHKEALLGSTEELLTYGVMPDFIFLSPGDFQQAQFEIEGASELSKVFVNVTTGAYQEGTQGGKGSDGYTLGVSGIRLANGSMIVPDAWVPDQYAWHLRMDTWECRSVGPAPHAAGTQPGEPPGVLQRRDNEDAYEMRYRSVYNILCHDPAANAVQKLPAR